MIHFSHIPKDRLEEWYGHIVPPEAIFGLMLGELDNPRIRGGLLFKDDESVWAWLEKVGNASPREVVHGIKRVKRVVDALGLPEVFAIRDPELSTERFFTWAGMKNTGRRDENGLEIWAWRALA